MPFLWEFGRASTPCQHALTTFASRFARTRRSSELRSAKRRSEEEENFNNLNLKWLNLAVINSVTSSQRIKICLNGENFPLLSVSFLKRNAASISHIDYSRGSSQGNHKDAQDSLNNPVPLSKDSSWYKAGVYMICCKVNDKRLFWTV
jgi:hypothetical protein